MQPTPKVECKHQKYQKSNLFTGQDEYVWQIHVPDEVLEAEVMFGMGAAILIVVAIFVYGAYRFSAYHKKNRE